jgi:hypothetical protein
MDYDKRHTLRAQVLDAIKQGDETVPISTKSLLALLNYIDELENDLTVETHYGE